MDLIIILLLFVTGYVLGQYRRGLVENKGEALVRKLLCTSLCSDEYHLLNNITLSIDSGSTQIDHILVSTRGVFVIETKHYSGWIFANEKSKKWTQVIYKGKWKFQNPIRQNYLHVITIKKLLDFLPGNVIHSVVVFTGSAEFKTNKPEGVFSPGELVDYILTKPEGTLSANRVAFCVGKIECSRYQLSGKTDIEHKSHLIKKFGNES